MIPSSQNAALLLHIDSQNPHHGYFVDGWDDLVQPATAVNPPGGVGPATYNVTDSTLDFVEGSDNRCDFNFQVPHRWLEASSVKLHLHVYHSTNGVGNTRWTVSYRVVNRAGAKPGWTTPAAIIVAAPASTNHVVLDLLTITMAAKTISCVVQVQLVRNGGHGNDTYGGDVQLISADLHFQSDTATGSVAEGTK